MSEEMLTWDCKERLVSNLKNNPKGYLEYQKIIIGSWITIGDPSVAEIMAKGGFIYSIRKGVCGTLWNLFGKGLILRASTVWFLKG